MLPTIDQPTYEIKIPSTGKAITIRPFLVKEEKLLLMALQSNDDREIINTTKQVIKNCIIDDEIDVDKLPFFDIDYLFIALRAKSVGESIDIKFTCNASVNGEKCGNVFPARIDISNSKIVKDDTISNDIALSGSLRMKMKYPSYAVMKTILDDDVIMNKKIQIIVGSIEYIQDKDKIYSTKDVSKEELISFVENLTQDQFRKLEHFVDNFPSFVVTTQATCDKCGFHHRLEYRDFSSFFA